MRTKGFALLGTLLLLAMLTALALYLRVQSTTESQIALVHAAREEASMAVRAALEMPFITFMLTVCLSQVLF